MSTPGGPPANIPLASGGPPIVAVRMVEFRNQLSRELGYEPPQMAAWWQVFERLLDVHEGSQQETRGRQ